jgi:hypothetical protein
VFSRQIKPDSVVRVADRILTMTHQCDVVERNRAAHAVRRLGTFESDLAQSLRGVWEASEGIVAGLPFPPHVVVTWNDGGGVLYGHIKDTREGTTALYSNATIPASPDGAWTFLSTDAVGGSEFTPMPLLGFAECVRDAVRADGDDDGDPA